MVAAVFIFRDFERSSNASFLGTAVKLSITKGATPLQQTLLPPRIPTSNRRAEPGVNRAQTLQNMIGARRNDNATTSSRLVKPTYVPSRRKWDKPEHLDRRAAAESSERYISVTWTPTHAWHCDHTKALLKAILDQQHKSKFETATGDLQSQGCTNSTEIMNKKFGPGYNHIWLRSRLDHIRRLYLDTKLLRNRFGFQ
ncbi:hypothetical protein H4Q26_008093 [Puccinia striiformis f. sp. tritici PST-130]|nr:hypothetical protein H4Q26_008093 [Puccinia striiformis f. sp. tritici PST-130]